jgi:hypothetical protein
MSRRLFSFFFAIVVLTAVTFPVWAKTDSNASIKTTITLYSKVTLGSTSLAPGHYDVTVEGNQAKFEQGGKVVAQVPCTLKTLASKAPQTQFLADQGRMTEIQVSGKTEAIDFPAGQTSGN